jgi:hypothetical protein
MAEHKDHLMQTLRRLEASGAIGGLPKEPSEGFSKNAEAERLFGLRRTDCTAFDQPSELDYHCPVCQYPQISDENYDGRLHWSEYESFIWCSVCNVDYPSCLCLPREPQRATGIFLSSVREAISRATPPAPTMKEIPVHKFWMVYRVGHGNPSKMHETPESALAEAKRLCLKEGAQFVILEAVALVEPAEPKITNLRKPPNG